MRPGILFGLTGGYCAGKNTVAAIMEGLGWTCIDVDRLGHAAIELERGRILARFGPGVLGSDGRIDRKALAAIVFSDSQALADQEAIVHPLAIRLLDERIAAAREAAAKAGREALVCVNAALLYLAPQAALCDAVLVVRAPLLLRLRRAKQRDGLDSRAVLRRIWKQRGLWSRRRAGGRPAVALWNDGSGDALKRAVERALTRARRAADLHPLSGASMPGS